MVNVIATTWVSVDSVTSAREENGVSQTVVLVSVMVILQHVIPRQVYVKTVSIILLVIIVDNAKLVSLVTLKKVTVRLNTAINRADFVSWSMLYT